MIELTQALYNVLVNDETVRNLVGRYNGLPCVFTFDPWPEAAPLPLVVTAGDVSDVGGPIDTKNSRGRLIDRDVRCYSEANGDPAAVEALATYLRDKFHKLPEALDLPGWTTVALTASGPVAADLEDRYARTVTLTVAFAKEE